MANLLVPDLILPFVVSSDDDHSTIDIEDVPQPSGNICDFTEHELCPPRWTTIYHVEQGGELVHEL